MPSPRKVRQLQNTCRSLTVIARGRSTHLSELPPEPPDHDNVAPTSSSWQEALRRCAEQELKQGKSAILDTAVPEFERIMIETALSSTGGRRRDASLRLGWGRNTLTRKIKELGMGGDEEEDS